MCTKKFHVMCFIVIFTFYSDLEPNPQYLRCACICPLTLEDWKTSVQLLTVLVLSSGISGNFLQKSCPKCLVHLPRFPSSKELKTYNFPCFVFFLMYSSRWVLYLVRLFLCSAGGLFSIHCQQLPKTEGLQSVF